MIQPISKPLSKNNSLQSQPDRLALSKAQPTQKDLSAIVNPEIDYRIAEAAVLKTQPLVFEQAPVPPISTAISGTISQQKVAQSLQSTFAEEGLSSKLAVDATNRLASSRLSASSLSSGGLTSGGLSSSSLWFPWYNVIWGTPNDDDITGTNQRDFIFGKAGNDTLRGGNGNDIVIGGAGDDIMSGDHVPAQTTQSNDILSGGSGEDQLFGRIGRDYLFGGNDNDQLFGGSDNDLLFGGNGDDQLFGGIVAGDASFNPDPDGNDRLFGGRGNDFLDGGVGSDLIDGSNSWAKGMGEIDILFGGLGQDIFVLGSYAAAYYTQGGANQDFAVMADFSQADDTVRLNGDASQYVLAYDATEGSTALGYLGSGSFELVGVFADQDISAVSLTSSTFDYV